MASLTLVRAYQHSFETRPNATLAVTGGVFNALGDIVAQTYQNTFGKKEHERPPGYDFVRTLRFFCFGFVISPFLGRWNAFLETKFPLRTVASSGKISMLALGKRVAADQLIMAPTGLAIFIAAMGTMEGRRSRQIRQKYAEMYAPALITNWKVWPMAQLVNFRFMPLPYRIPFQSTCGIFWTLYLSVMNSKEDQKLDRQIAMKQMTA
ncbi:hypothetical protein HGRIS_007633 [Hohenbuehelia grisea]|uniref:Uncharacterized protein n=1 Tax=Hohenbuehelia grisea TaxID=104357 RepID=A0ABR3J5G5_9AGAR